MISIVTEKIDTQALLQSVSSPKSGATVLFVGTTRQFTGGRETTFLSYECYQEMAIAKLQELSDRAAEKWAIEQCGIVHRIGCLLYTSPSPRDATLSRMPSSA